MFKRSLFDAEHDTLRRSIADFLDTEVVPHHAIWTQTQDVPAAIWRRAGERGFLCRSLPPDYGGYGRDFRDSVVIIEEIARRRLSGCLFFLQSDIIAPLLHRVSTEIQRRKWLPQICSGNAISALALTEPQSGSDLFAMTCRAEREGDEMVLNGVKTHISNGSTANTILVAARSSKPGLDGQAGFSLVVVDGTAPGLTREKISKSGMRALDTTTLRLKDCRIPAGNLLGAEGMGIVYLLTFLAVERLVLSIYAQASAEAQLRELIAFCHARKTVGGTVLDFQNTQFVLADLYGECAANRAFIDQCVLARLNDQADPRSACIAKLRTTETQKKVAAFGVQLRGAAGISGLEGERAVSDLVDSAAQSVWGGSSEVMRDVIGRSLANIL